MKYLSEKNESDSYFVLSAGIRAYPESPYSYTIHKLKALGVKEVEHVQTKLSQDLVDNADVIICMTNKHKNFVKEHFGAHSYLINEIVHGTHDDLEDDDENRGYTSLKEFVEMTIDKIHEAIPSIYAYVQKN